MFEWFKKKAAKRVESPAPVPQMRVAQQIPVERPRARQTHHLGYISVKDNISLTIDGKMHSIGRAHINFDKIVRVLDTIDEDTIINAELIAKLESLINVGASITRKTKGKVTVNDVGEVLHNGKLVHNVVATRIAEFVRQGLPFAPLARFLENLMTNPSDRSIEQLYAFLEHGGFPITPDGCFLGYKGVTADFKDKHTNSFDNSVGAKQSMPREKVNPDPHAACSVGFHIGTHSFATEFASGGGQVVMVKVNPRDAVSVPHDASCQKLRVCEYEVVAMCPGKVAEPLSDIGYQGDEDYDDEDEDLVEIGIDNDFYDDLEAELDDLDAEDEAEEPDDDEDEVVVVVQAPKRAACTYCGAKGGKKHAGDCGRPQKQ